MILIINIIFLIGVFLTVWFGSIVVFDGINEKAVPPATLILFALGVVMIFARIIFQERGLYMYWGLNIDELNEELWEELERIQDGKSGHTIAIKADCKTEAAMCLCTRIQQFIYNRMYECDEYGTNKD